MKTIKMNSKIAAGAVAMALFFGAPSLDTSIARPPEHGGGGGVERGGGAVRAPAPRMEAPRQAPVQRSFHGSVGRANMGVVHPNFNPGVRGGFQGNIHRNYDVEVNHGFGRYYGGGFHVGAFVPVLPFGYSTFNYGGVPYYYDDGTYYQQGPSGYQVVNPPNGAELPGPPSGAVAVTAADGQTYYYADGVFYAPQDNGYGVVGAPLGVAVPELPSGATQTVINGTVYYVYNNVYYQPMIQNGVTTYVTVAPQ